MKITPYIRIARFDHWIKNVFMLPGVFLALYDHPEILGWDALGRIFIGIFAIGLIASGNYIMNEVLDAPRDLFHPVKRHRPVPSGQINISCAYLMQAFLVISGLSLSLLLGKWFFLTAFSLLVMGVIYNVSPIRTKDLPYLDVLTESVNNPIRLLAGWYCVGMTVFPPVSLVLAYWMVGAFFMAVKRLAEYRRIGNGEVAHRYRDSFKHYTEERLLVSTVYYAVAFGLFFGIFLARYRLELILSIPFLAGFIGWYIHLGFKEDSPAQYPEKLHQSRRFVAYAVFTVTLMIILLFIDIPIISAIFRPTLHTPE
jgi:4-hydroxybenzoate polyprenyltransferase